MDMNIKEGERKGGREGGNFLSVETIKHTAFAISRTCLYAIRNRDPES